MYILYTKYMYCTLNLKFTEKVSGASPSYMYFTGNCTVGWTGLVNLCFGCRVYPMGCDLYMYMYCICTGTYDYIKVYK